MRVKFYIQILFVVTTVLMQSGCSTLTAMKEKLDVSRVIDIIFTNKDKEAVSADSEKDSQEATEIKKTSFPKPGEKVQVFDSKTQQNIIVVFGETFPSASGKWCSTVTMTNESTSETRDSLVCLNENNEWDKNPVDIQLIQSH